jgi:hypothetical protein
MLTRETKEALFSQHGFELQGWVTSNLPTLDTATAIARLLKSLPDIPIKSEAAFITTCKAWLRIQQCLGFWKEVLDDVVEFIADNLPLDGMDSALEDLKNNFHRFGGRSKGQFILWAHKRLKRRPGYLDLCRINVSIADFDDDQESDPKFEYTRSGDIFLVNLGEDENGPILWRVPTLKLARSLWPVRAKKLPTGKYFVAKTVLGHTVAVHRLMFNVNLGDHVAAWDGNLLNYGLIRYTRTVKVTLGDMVGPEEVEEESWIHNLHVTHDTWGRNPIAAERQTQFDSRMLQISTGVNEDGDVETLEVGGWQTGLGPVDASTPFRATKSGKNTSANLVKLDREDYAEGDAVRKEMAQSEYGAGYKRDGDTAIMGSEAAADALKQALGSN